ncbi:hypothetical protein ASG25_04360 [Rhizobium sp. Leaf384]|nr:hypothetical protein ASG25_04360 [Rhizobium sp. Leaf384]
MRAVSIAIAPAQRWPTSGHGCDIFRPGIRAVFAGSAGAASPFGVGNRRRIDGASALVRHRMPQPA